MYAVRIKHGKFICPVWYKDGGKGEGGAVVVDEDFATKYDTIEAANDAAAYVRHGIDMDPETLSVTVREID